MLCWAEGIARTQLCVFCGGVAASKINAVPPRELMDVLVALVSPVSHAVPFP